MKAFDVTVRTDSHTLSFIAIGRTSIDVHMSALELFDLCYVSVIPLARSST